MTIHVYTHPNVPENGVTDVDTLVTISVFSPFHPITLQYSRYTMMYERVCVKTKTKPDTHVTHLIGDT